MIMKKNKAIKITGIVVLVLVITYLASPTYVQRALIYQKVGIDDYPIFPNRTVEAGNPQSWKNHESYNMKAISDDVMSKIEELQTIAFVVIKDGKLKHEEYWGDYSAESKTNSFSAAKSIVGLLMGCAIDDGFIKGVDEKVSNYFPEIIGEYSGELTIRNVLTMSSGLNWDESYGSLFSTTTEAYYGNNLPKLILGLEVDKQPGKEFRYLSGNTQLLAMIITKATGKKLGQYASEKLWIPLQAEHDALWCLDKDKGLEKAYCCFNSNATDFARIGQMVLDSGRWNGQQIISEDYILESVSPANYLKETGTNNQLNYYGFQWWIMAYKGHHVAYARGILGQYIFVIPSMNAVVVRLGHVRSNRYKNHHPLCAYTYLDAAFQIFD